MDLPHYGFGVDLEQLTSYLELLSDPNEKLLGAFTGKIKPNDIEFEKYQIMPDKSQHDYLIILNNKLYFIRYLRGTVPSFIKAVGLDLEEIENAKIKKGLLNSSIQFTIKNRKKIMSFDKLSPEDAEIFLKLLQEPDHTISKTNAISPISENINCNSGTNNPEIVYRGYRDKTMEIDGKIGGELFITNRGFYVKYILESNSQIKMASWLGGAVGNLVASAAVKKFQTEFADNEEANRRFQEISGAFDFQVMSNNLKEIQLIKSGISGGHIFIYKVHGKNAMMRIRGEAYKEICSEIEKYYPDFIVP